MAQTQAATILVLGAIALLIAASCTSIDASTSKALAACKEIEDERVRADCIVRVAKDDPHR